MNSQAPYVRVFYLEFIDDVSENINLKEDLKIVDKYFKSVQSEVMSAPPVMRSERSAPSIFRDREPRESPGQKGSRKIEENSDSVLSSA